MNSCPPHSRDPQLAALLRSWKVPAETPPRFPEAVWRRIARRTNPRPGLFASDAASWLNGIAVWIRRPRFAWLYLLTLVTLGASAGIVRGQVQASRLADGLQGRYVLSIDPFSGGPR